MGGAGLVVAGHCIVEPGRSSFASGAEPWPFAKYEREKTREKVLKIHRGGAKASIEVFHAGQDARTVDYAKGPSGFIRPDGVEVKEMDEAMMQETLHWYAETAAGCRKSVLIPSSCILDTAGFRPSFCPPITIIVLMNTAEASRTAVGSRFESWRPSERQWEKIIPSIFVSAPTSGSRIPSALRTLCTS